MDPTRLSQVDARCGPEKPQFDDKDAVRRRLSALADVKACALACAFASN